jgi:cellobiose phosphorylase
VEGTGDTGVLDEVVSFVTGRPVKDDEEGYYDLPQVANETATLYEHCLRALRRAAPRGRHSLPLMGSGDWNDGMNRVGIGGQGESVWLGFFLHEVLSGVSRLALARQDNSSAQSLRLEAEALQDSLNAHAWDGDWYLRAWFDDGTAMGSAQSEECQIDSIPQSWSVLSGAGQPERSRKAMDNVSKRLVGRGTQVRLFDPPFNTTPHDPGYIKGYPPGIRENGGQYTHAAVWSVMAWASLALQSRTANDAAEAWQLCFQPGGAGSEPPDRGRLSSRTLCHGR